MCARSGVGKLSPAEGTAGSTRRSRKEKKKWSPIVEKKKFTSRMRVNWMAVEIGCCAHAKWRRSRFHFVIAQQRGWKIWLRSYNDVRLPNCLSNILHRWSACYDNNRVAFHCIANRWTNIILSLHSQVVEFAKLKRGWNATFYIAHFRRNSAYLAAFSLDSMNSFE